MSKLSNIVKKVASTFQNPSSLISLNNMQLAMLADNISFDIIQEKEERFLSLT